MALLALCLGFHQAAQNSFVDLLVLARVVEVEELSGSGTRKTSQAHRPTFPSLVSLTLALNLNWFPC
jgi:hypothetical protein